MQHTIKLIKLASSLEGKYLSHDFVVKEIKSKKISKIQFLTPDGKVITSDQIMGDIVFAPRTKYSYLGGILFPLIIDGKIPGYREPMTYFTSEEIKNLKQALDDAKVKYKFEIEFQYY